MAPDQTIDSQVVVEALQKASNKVKERREEIRELDAACGDGDLGITVKRGFTAVEQLLNNIEDAPIDKILRQAGMEFNAAAASTFGALFATALIKASEEIENKAQIDVEDLSLMLEAACTGIKSRGGAELGDKTLLDALIPATESVKHVASNNGTIKEALEKAATAAEEGLSNTKGMEPKTGRAKQLGGQAKEVQDPGATIVYLLFDALASYKCQS